MSYSHKKPQLLHRGRHRKPRPRSFKTEEAAHKFAKEEGLKDYILKNLKFDSAKEKKYVIMVKE